MTINEAITAVLTASHNGDQNFQAFLLGDDPEVVAMRKALVQLADAVREADLNHEYRLDLRVMRIQGVWCCEKQHKCTWQGFALYHGLAWGTVPNEFNVWKQRHDTECGGKLIQLVEPSSESVDTSR